MIRCLIVDDEPPAREVLESYIAELPKLQLVASCSNAVEALEWMDKESIHLIFLDINMPKLSGINFYKSLSTKPKVIFTTAYAEHAVEGFELEAVDYLLKPFSFERFIKAVNKVEVGQKEANSADFIMLKADKKNHKVNFDQILYFESIGDYVKVHLRDAKTLIISETLRKLEEVLPYTFLRVHKTYIISIPHLEYVEGNQITIGKTKIPIGQSYRDKVNDVFKK
ncbi:LytR/AlgR family response regulator transcription factor [Ekhidna sp.]|uniref:LytR/AlgR family response regulator transcription factor n=1 Tax=Ekhidna sp. TaxID=2608089 RepID=UPI003B5A4B01